MSHNTGQDAGDGQVGVERFRAAAQDDCIPRLEAEGRRVGGDVGACLVDDTDHAERDAHLAHHQLVGPLPHLCHLTHRIGEGSHFTQGAGDAGDPRGIEHEPVEHRAGESLGAPRFQVYGVFGHDRGGAAFQGVGHLQQHIVFRGGGKACHLQGGLAGVGGNGGYL